MHTYKTTSQSYLWHFMTELAVVTLQLVAPTPTKDNDAATDNEVHALEVERGPKLLPLTVMVCPPAVGNTEPAVLSDANEGTA